MRGRRVAMVYQDPMASLNPVMTIGRQLMEVPMLHEGRASAAARARALDMLARGEPAGSGEACWRAIRTSSRAASSSASSSPWR